MARRNSHAPGVPVNKGLARGRFGSAIDREKELRKPKMPGGQARQLLNAMGRGEIGGRAYHHGGYGAERARRMVRQKIEDAVLMQEHELTQEEIHQFRSGAGVSYHRRGDPSVPLETIMAALAARAMEENG